MKRHVFRPNDSRKDLALSAWQCRHDDHLCHTPPPPLFAVSAPVCSYHTIHGKAIAAADLKDGQELTTISQHKLTVKIDK
jgi:hypothetical protein